MIKNLIATGLFTLPCLLAAQSDGSLAVVGKDGKTVRIPPTPIIRYSEVKLFSIKRTGYLPSKDPLTVVQPSKFLFEQRNAEKGWGLRLVRLKLDGGSYEFTVKIGFSSMTAEKDSVPFPDGPELKNEKAADGTWSLSLPKDLPDGAYAVVGFDDYFSASINGLSTSGFSWKYGVAWMFKVGGEAAAATTAPATK